MDVAACSLRTAELLNASLSRQVGSFVARYVHYLSRAAKSVWKPLVLMTIAAWPAFGNAASVVCWANRFAGMHEASNRAEAALAGTTRDLSRVVIYFEKVDEYYFYQSNYIPSQERSVAKITSTEPMNMTAVLSNIILRRSPGSQVDGAALELARNHVTVYTSAPAPGGTSTVRAAGVMLASLQ